MMSELQSKSFFPTDFYSVNILNEVENDLYENELVKLSKAEKTQNHSNCGGWQSNNNLWSNQSFKSLLDTSSKYIIQILSEKTKNHPQFVIRSMWGNINSKGDFNFTHTHPSGWMSAVYYIKVPDLNSKIVFEDPRPAAIMDFQNSCLGVNSYIEHAPKTGELILFPSWLPHFVYPNQMDELRISISFNIELVV